MKHTGWLIRILTLSLVGTLAMAEEKLEKLISPPMTSLASGHLNSWWYALQVRSVIGTPHRELLQTFQCSSEPRQLKVEMKRNDQTVSYSYDVKFQKDDFVFKQTRGDKVFIGKSSFHNYSNGSTVLCSDGKNLCSASIPQYSPFSATSGTAATEPGSSEWIEPAYFVNLKICCDNKSCADQLREIIRKRPGPTLGDRFQGVMKSLMHAQ